ncbi:Hypothetical predicted protein [Marmota monax]|uniref:Signal recognition particle 14 kDa protein n=1 Tax=Marmota monax TaxID=9995 RepID=A0A5E4BJI0_MARMO|nr:hypothetical protein GHT09_003468 [Marmota monax]VTJ69089.1 Hypothetical predicted protein [Marmota monax]
MLTRRVQQHCDGAPGERAVPDGADQALPEESVVGSTDITLKKYDGRTKPAPRKGSMEGVEPSDNTCLLRAMDGKKKISTVVSSKEVNTFQMAYLNLLRANMEGLKERQKEQ